MAIERIEIVITERGTRSVQRSLQDLGSTARTSASAIDFLKRALLILGGVQIIRGIVNLSNTFVNLQNRLKNVTTEVDTLNVLTQELFDIANRTRTTFEGTAEVFTRVAISVKELGLSIQEVLDFQESLNQALLLSGASAIEAKAALIQLSQGLASNTLRGDELRSVLEQLPTVADVIAKSMGVTRGELRRMGQEGLITAGAIIKAFKEARGELAEKFARTVPTIGQAFVILQNQTLRAIGAIDQATGASAALSRIIILLADNMETLLRVIGAVAVAIGVAFAQQAIGRAIAAVRALTVAIAANPIGAIAVAITAAAAALAFFSDKITITEGSITTLQDVAVATFQVVSESVQQLADIFSDELDVVAGLWASAFGEFEFSIKGVLQAAATIFDTLIGVVTGTVNAIVTAFERLGTEIPAIFRKAMNAAVNLVESGVNAVIDILNKLPKVNIDKIDIPDLFADNAQGAAQSFGESVGNAFMAGMETSTAAQDVLGDVLARADQLAQQRTADREAQRLREQQAREGLGEKGSARFTEAPNAKFSLDEIRKNLEDENRLLRLNSVEREIQTQILKIEEGLKRQLTDAERAEFEARIRTNETLKIRADLLEEVRGPQEEFAVKQQELNRLFEEGAISVGQYNLALAQLQAQMLETGTTSVEGFRRGFANIKADILDVASAAENVLVNAWHSAEDALVEFVQTGEFNFSKFVDGILADLTRLLARQALAGLINALGGAAGGGGGGLGGLLSSFASGSRQAGGPVEANRPFLVGERGPELFVPKQGGNIMPNEALPGAAAPAPEVNVQVVNVTNEEEVPRAMASQRGDKVILNSLARNRGAVRNALGI